MCPLPWFFDRHFPFKRLILTRQLSVFSNLLLHQISCLLTDFGLPFPSLWCFSCAPWHITKASAEAGSAEDVSTGSEAAVWWGRTNVSMSSQGWRQLSCRTLDPSLPCLQCTPQGLCAAWDCRARGGTLLPPAPQILLLTCSSCSLFGRDSGIPGRAFFWDSPFWERAQLSPWDTLCGLPWSKQ